MRIAVIARDWAPGTGLNLVTENLLEGLAGRHEIRLFLLFRGFYRPRGERITLPYPCDEYTPASAGSSERNLSRASRYYGTDAQRLTWLDRNIAAFGADRIVAFDYNVAPFIGLLQSDAPKILNAIDSEVRYCISQIRNGHLSTGVFKRLLAAWLTGREHFRKCAAVVTVSPADSASVKRFQGVRNVFTVPNGVDYKRYAPDPSIVRNPNRLIFCGSLSFLPNVQAVQWFVRRCWPEILRRRPTAEFLIIGKNPPTELAARFEGTAGVRLVGYVDDVRPYILGSAVSVAPMVSGSGVKNKILEAWALATPIVATRLATQGLLCRNETNLLVADSAAQFAASVASLLGDHERRERIGAAGRSHVIQHYSWGAARAKFNAIVEQPLACGQTVMEVGGTLPRADSKEMVW